MAKATQIESTIQDLANEFAKQVLDAIRAMSLGEILAVTGGGGGAARGGARPAPPSAVKGAPRGAAKLPRVGRGKRRTAEDIDSTIDAIVGVLRSAPAGLRAEQIRGQLGLSRKDIDLPIATALENKRIRKTGERRATKYFVR